jgi:hypothetical protein
MTDTAVVVVVEKRKGGQLGNKNAQKWTEVKAMKLGRGILAWFEEDKDHILFEDYFREIGLYRRLLAYLQKTFPSFLALIEECRQIQESRIVNLGLQNKINVGMCIFILKNNHGYKDQQDHDHTFTVPEIIYEYRGPHKEQQDPYFGDVEEAEIVE